MSSYTEALNNREGPCVTRDTAWDRIHRDLQATAMSVDWSGQWVLLAGRYVDVQTFKLFLLVRKRLANFKRVPQEPFGATEFRSSGRRQPAAKVSSQFQT